MHKPSYPSWPKPQAFPVCAFILLLVNLCLYYGVYTSNSSIYWLTPTIFFNIFFFWAEWKIYKRDRRNFDGWREEVDAFLQPSGKNRWGERLQAVQRPRRH